MSSFYERLHFLSEISNVPRRSPPINIYFNSSIEFTVRPRIQVEIKNDCVFLGNRGGKPTFHGTFSIVSEGNL